MDIILNPGQSATLPPGKYSLEYLGDYALNGKIRYHWGDGVWKCHHGDSYLINRINGGWFWESRYYAYWAGCAFVHYQEWLPVDPGRFSAQRLWKWFEGEGEYPYPQDNPYIDLNSQTNWANGIQENYGTICGIQHWGVHQRRNEVEYQVAYASIPPQYGYCPLEYRLLIRSGTNTVVYGQIGSTIPTVEIISTSNQYFYNDNWSSIGEIILTNPTTLINYQNSSTGCVLRDETGKLYHKATFIKLSTIYRIKSFNLDNSCQLPCGCIYDRQGNPIGKIN